MAEAHQELAGSIFGDLRIRRQDNLHFDDRRAIGNIDGLRFEILLDRQWRRIARLEPVEEAAQTRLSPPVVSHHERTRHEVAEKAPERWLQGNGIIKN